MGICALRTSIGNALCSMGDLAIRSENHERHVRRLEQERDAMEAKYEVCIAWHFACVQKLNSPQEAVKEYKASQAELDALVQNLESL